MISLEYGAYALSIGPKNTKTFFIPKTSGFFSKMSMQRLIPIVEISWLLPIN